MFFEERYRYAAPGGDEHRHQKKTGFAEKVPSNNRTCKAGQQKMIAVFTTTSATVMMTRRRGNSGKAPRLSCRVIERKVEESRVTASSYEPPKE